MRKDKNKRNAQRRKKKKKKGAILSCMFGNKEMRKEKRIIHFFFSFAKTKEIKRKPYVFDFYVT